MIAHLIEPDDGDDTGVEAVNVVIAEDKAGVHQDRARLINATPGVFNRLPVRLGKAC